MSSAQFQEALTLTLGGIGTAFVVLLLLMALIVGMKRVIQTQFVQRRTGAIAAVEASEDRRNKALAAAIAVSVALTTSEAIGRQDVQEDAST